MSTGVLTDKTVWENYYKGKSTMRTVNGFINRSVFDAEIIDKLGEYIKAHGKGSIMEMGCGGSEWLPYLYKKFGVEPNGIDYLEVGCKKAEELLQVHNINKYNIYCADFFEFHKTLGVQYDYVVSFGVVEHFEPPARPIAAFKNYLKDDGILVSTCPNTGGFSMKLQKSFDKQVYDNHVKFNLKDFVRFHEEGGYKVIYSSYTGFLSFNNLVFSNFSIAGRLAKIIVKLANAPIVFFFYLLRRFLGINIQSSSLCSNMIVVAVKNNARS